MRACGGSAGALVALGDTRYHQFGHWDASGERILWVVVVRVTHEVTRAGCWGIGRFCHRAFDLEDHENRRWVYPLNPNA